MVKKRNNSKKLAPKIHDHSRLFAFLSVLLSIVGFFMALLIRRNDEYVMFYAKQSLVIFLGFAVSSVIGVVPLIGKIASPLLWLLFIILWITSLVYSLTGNEKDTPFIGRYADKIKF